MERNRNYFVDYLKGISIAGIVLFHLLADFLKLPGVLSKVVAFAGAGIHIFNICSGYGLALSYRKRPVRYKDFLLKRFVKVYIPYAIAITLYFIFSWITYQGDNVLGAYLSHIFLYKMFVPEYMTSFGGHLWYISTIVQFYLVFILLIKAKDYLGNKKFLIISCVVSIMWMTVVAVQGKGEERVWSNFFLQYLWEFAIGMCLADISDEKIKEKFSKIPFIALIGVFLVSFGIFAVTGFKGGFLKCYNDIFALLSIGVIYLLLYKISILAKLFIYVSSFSYELYLIHILVFKIAFYYWNATMPGAVVGLIALILSVVLSWGYSIVVRKIVKLFSLVTLKNT